LLGKAAREPIVKVNTIVAVPVKICFLSLPVKTILPAAVLFIHLMSTPAGKTSRRTFIVFGCCRDKSGQTAYKAYLTAWARIK